MSAVVAFFVVLAIIVAFGLGYAAGVMTEVRRYLRKGDRR